MGAGVRPKPTPPAKAQLPATFALEAAQGAPAALEPALCSGGTALALLALLSLLHLLLYLRSSSAGTLLPVLHATRPGAPAPDAYPRRSDCVVEAQWEAALQPGQSLPWSNAGTYDAVLLRELSDLGVPLTRLLC